MQNKENPKSDPNVVLVLCTTPCTEYFHFFIRSQYIQYNSVNTFLLNVMKSFESLKYA